MVSFCVSLTSKPKRSLPFNQLLFVLKHHLHTLKSVDAAAISNALTFSANSESQVLGTQLQGRTFKLGFSNDTFTQNNLIKMYTKCGVLSDGLKVFGEMTERNLVSWTLIISSAVQNGEYELALEVYVDMTRTGLVANEFALGSVLKGCANIGADSLGCSIHSFAFKVGLQKNLFVAASLLHMYANFGVVELAESVFEDVYGHDVGFWNAMIGGYTRCRLGFEAMHTASLMHRKGMVMDQFTFVNALKACLITGDVDVGRQIHGLIVQSGKEMSTSVMNALMDMYFKNDKKDAAFQIFNSTQERDVVSWNTMFASFSQDVDASEGASLFKRFMFTSLKPSYLTFSILFRLCGEVLELDFGLQLFSLAFHFGFCGQACVTSSLIYMFSRCGEFHMAHLVFDSITYKNVNNWNELLSGYNLNCGTEALEVFCHLWSSGIELDECSLSCALEAWSKAENLLIGKQIHGIVAKLGFASNGYVCSSLIKGYIKYRLFDEVSKCLCELEILDMVSWSATISAFAHQGCISEAVRFLNHLKANDGKPDEFILGSILSGCAELASYHLTESFHSLIVKTGYEANTFVASAVIDAYAKSGCVRSATTAFDQSAKSVDIVLYNTMIMAYAHHGLISEAVEVLEKIKLANLKPSPATFVSILLACSHLGLVDQGRVLFRSMTLDYGLDPSPDSYGTLIDLLSRNGLLQEAKNTVEAMPFKPWPAVWRSLLNGCRIHGSRELGKWAARELLQLDPADKAAYVLLSKIYTEDGDWENASKVTIEMMEWGLKNSSGISYVEI